MLPNRIFKRKHGLIQPRWECVYELKKVCVATPGLADPFVKGSFASCRFKTKVQRKTLRPRWFEEFKVPIASWELPTLLVLHVQDKDQFRDDDLGYGMSYVDTLWGCLFLKSIKYQLCLQVL